MKNCLHCQAKFTVETEDKKFYQSISPVFNGLKYEIPEPTLCPDCRLQRRLNWRTELHLFLRPSSKSGQQILSHYPPDSKMTIYSTEEWWADDWNANNYAQDFDFAKPFFGQFQAFMQKVPVLPLFSPNNENCDYVNNASSCKNSYLISGASYTDNCYYGNYMISCQDCIDCSFITDCELCYDCIDCHKGYKLKYSIACENCSDSYFLKNCTNCKNCFGCINQNNKEYMYFNQQLTKEQYEATLKQFELHKRSKLEQTKKTVTDFHLKFPHKYYHGMQNENFTGDYISNCQNCFNCFDVIDCQDCKYVSNSLNSKNCMDHFAWGMTAENCYECTEVGKNSQNVAFSFSMFTCYNAYYSINCVNSKNIFGCVSLRNKEYCIFNKQYSKEEYEELVPRIIEHMKSTGEWGEFFPMKICPFNYNQSIAQDSMPITAEKAKELKINWAPEKNPSPPENPPQIPDSILECSPKDFEQTYYSEKSGKAFKIIKQEYEFYKDNNIPFPNTTFDERLLKRSHQRNPRKLFNRHCDKCQAPISTAYSPEKPEIIYCEQCYQETIY